MKCAVHRRALAFALVWAGTAGLTAQGGARISGRITTHDGRPLISAAVSLRPAHAGAAETPPQDVAILPDGSFTFRNIPPGEYVIRAHGDVDRRSPSRFGTFRLRVEGRDIDRVELALSPGGQIEGRVVVESAGKASPREVLRGLRVRAPLVDDPTFGDALTGDVHPDGSYAIRGVMAGSHVIVVEGLREPWVMKSVTWRGRDMTAGFQAESRQVYSDVRVTITDHPAMPPLSLSR